MTSENEREPDFLLGSVLFACAKYATIALEVIA
jgi:hypothetical protein